MTNNKIQRARDDQIFLIMGVSEVQETAECAIVMAAGLDAAKLAFERRFEGFTPMTWPSLREIRMSVDMMELARDGGLPDDLIVIDKIRPTGKGAR